jgi:hypothetical protein
MALGDDGFDRKGRRGGRLCAFAFTAVLACGIVAPAAAQMFSDRPPPVPPALVPDAPPAMNLAPPSAPAPIPSLPPPLAQPSIAAAPPVVALPGAAAPGQAVLALTARYGKDLPVISNGLVWRVFSDRPDESGTFKLIREERGATPNIVLPPGGLRIEGRVGSSKIPQNQIAFSIYKGSQFEGGDRAPLVPNVAAGDVALLAEGTYYIISNYGDANSVVRSDIRVQAGKLTDVVITHRAAVITLKLVGDKGGEALANTAWSVITPGGDVIKESIGAFPRVVLSEGEYRAIAKNEGKVFERPFNVVNGVDVEVEVIAR